MDRLAPPRRVPVGVAVLTFDPTTGRVLLGQRTGKHGAGTWSFPGGWIDPGEGPLVAARREVLEETGLQIHEVEVFAPLPYVYTDFRPEVDLDCVTLYFTAVATGIPVVREPDKCLAWAWFPKHELPAPLFKPLADAGMRGLLAGR